MPLPAYLSTTLVDNTQRKPLQQNSNTRIGITRSMDAHGTLCGAAVPFVKVMPDEKYEYTFSTEISSFFTRGKYIGYRTVFADDDVLSEITAYKFLYQNEQFAAYLVNELKAYISAWKTCIHHHEHRTGTTCANPAFRDMLYAGISEIENLLAGKITTTLHALHDFNNAIEFLSTWNEIQHTMMVTYYANLIAFPDFIKTKQCVWDETQTCAMCQLHDRTIMNPVPNFLFLTGFFTPISITLPNNRCISQGVYVYKKADERAVIHEHVHGYMHEVRTSQIQILCEYIDEGFADWCAISLRKPQKVYKGTFREYYDFWIVFNSLPLDASRKLFELWVSNPNALKWQDFVFTAMECLRTHKEKHRSRKYWDTNERLDDESVEKLLRVLS